MSSTVDHAGLDRRAVGDVDREGTAAVAEFLGQRRHPVAPRCRRQRGAYPPHRSVRAMPSPIPVAAPVTNATLPLRPANSSAMKSPVVTDDFSRQSIAPAAAGAKHENRAAHCQNQNVAATGWWPHGLRAAFVGPEEADWALEVTSETSEHRAGFTGPPAEFITQHSPRAKWPASLGPPLSLVRNYADACIAELGTFALQVPGRTGRLCAHRPNEVVAGAIDLEFDVDGRNQEVLNLRGVNVIRKFPNRGIRVWAARTLSSDPLWQYINVRRFFIFVEEFHRTGHPVGGLRSPTTSIYGRRSRGSSPSSCAPSGPEITPRGLLSDRTFHALLKRTDNTLPTAARLGRLTKARFPC